MVLMPASPRPRGQDFGRPARWCANDTRTPPSGGVAEELSGLGVRSQTGATNSPLAVIRSGSARTTQLFGRPHRAPRRRQGECRRRPALPGFFCDFGSPIAWLKHNIGPGRRLFRGGHRSRSLPRVPQTPGEKPGGGAVSRRAPAGAARAVRCRRDLSAVRQAGWL